MFRFAMSGIAVFIGSLLCFGGANPANVQAAHNAIVDPAPAGEPLADDFELRVGLAKDAGLPMPRVGHAVQPGLAGLPAAPRSNRNCLVRRLGHDRTGGRRSGEPAAGRVGGDSPHGPRHSGQGGRPADPLSPRLARPDHHRSERLAQGPAPVRRHPPAAARIQTIPVCDTLAPACIGRARSNWRATRRSTWRAAPSSTEPSKPTARQISASSAAAFSTPASLHGTRPAEAFGW